MRWLSVLLCWVGIAGAVEPGVLVQERATPPGSPILSAYQTEGLPTRIDGITWLRTTDRRAFVYSDSLGEWVGSPYVLGHGSPNAAYTGGLYVGGVAADSASLVPKGIYVPERSVFVAAWWWSQAEGLVASNCTTAVFCRGTMSSDLNLGSWADGYHVQPNEVIDAGAVLCPYIVPKSSGPANPNYPNVWLEFAPLVTP